MPDLDWFALQVRERYERLVAETIRQKGYEELVPLYRSQRRWSDRVKTLELPLFPGYVFCRFDPRERLPILVTPGVHRVVGFGATPAPVDEDEMASIRRIIESGAAAQPWPYLRTGQAVRVEAGPLRGVEGIFLAHKGQCRLVVSVSLLQRSVAVEIDGGAVLPLGTGNGRS